MTKRAPYFHVYIGLMVVFASYAMGVTMRVREARLRGNVPPHGCSRKTSCTSDMPGYTVTLDQLVEKYGRGLCVVTGRFSYVDESGKPFRYNVRAFKKNVELKPDPTGPIYSEPFSGTGFHVGNGVVLMHYNFLEPLKSFTNNKQFADGGNQVFGGRFCRQVVTDVEARFNGIPEQTFTLKADGLQWVHWTPEFTFDLKGADIPALPLRIAEDVETFPSTEPDRAGETIFVLGFPGVATEFGPTRNPVLPNPLKLIAFQTVISGSDGNQFRVDTFTEDRPFPTGFPIFDRTGVVIGIQGYDRSGVCPNGRFPDGSVFSMGTGYGAHLWRLQHGLKCDDSSHYHPIPFRK